MHKKEKKGIHELYAEDPLAADKKLWDREPLPNTRRGFLKKGALTAMSLVLGAKMVYAEHFPAGMIPAALANSDQPFNLPGKHPG
jgi:sulfite oxidase